MHIPGPGESMRSFWLSWSSLKLNWRYCPLNNPLLLSHVFFLLFENRNTNYMEVENSRWWVEDWWDLEKKFWQPSLEGIRGFVIKEAWGNEVCVLRRKFLVEGDVICWQANASTMCTFLLSGKNHRPRALVSLWEVCWGCGLTLTCKILGESWGHALLLFSIEMT